MRSTVSGYGYPQPARATHKRRLLKRLTDVALIGCLLLGFWFVLSALSPWRAYPIDMSAQIAWRWWVLGLALVVITAALKRWGFAVIALLLVLTQLTVNAFSVTGSDRSFDNQTELTIAVANLGPPGRDPEPMLRWISEQDPDVIALVEADNSVMRTVPTLTERYPYRVEQVSGMRWPRLVLSKFPVKAVGLEGKDEREWWWSYIVRRSPTIELPDGQRLTLSVFHCSSPRTDEIRTGAISRIIRDGVAMAQWRATHGHPMIAIGDFNSTPLGELAQSFGRASGLRVASPGLVGGTWPATAPKLLSLPIDLGWHTDDVGLRVIQVSPSRDGDHRAVVFRARVQGGPTPSRSEPMPSSPPDSTPPPAPANAT